MVGVCVLVCCTSIVGGCWCLCGYVVNSVEHCGFFLLKCFLITALVVCVCKLRFVLFGLFYVVLRVGFAGWFCVNAFWFGSYFNSVV